MMPIKAFASSGVTHCRLTARAASEYRKNGGNPPIYSNTIPNVLRRCYANVSRKNDTISANFCTVTRVTRFPGNKTYRGTYPPMYLIINIGVTVLHIYINNKNIYYYYRVSATTARNTSRNTRVTPASRVLRLRRIIPTPRKLISSARRLAPRTPALPQPEHHTPRQATKKTGWKGYV
jgi:hypothetical protein